MTQFIKNAQDSETSSLDANIRLAELDEQHWDRNKSADLAKSEGIRVRDLNKIQSEAYPQVEEIRGIADAKATEMYAKAYNQSPEAVAFYEFTRTMQS